MVAILIAFSIASVQSPKMNKGIRPESFQRLRHLIEDHGSVNERFVAPNRSSSEIGQTVTVGGIDPDCIKLTIFIPSIKNTMKFSVSWQEMKSIAAYHAVDI